MTTVLLRKEGTPAGERDHTHSGGRVLATPVALCHSKEQNNRKVGHLTSAHDFKGFSHPWWGRPVVKFVEQEQVVAAPCMSLAGI